jgi:hypothetical protein
MRNYQRILAMALVTTLTVTTVAASRAYAEDPTGISYANRYTTVQVPERRVVVDYHSQDVRNTDIYRDDTANYTCRAYSGMDHQVLQEKYNQLKMQHMGEGATSPVGSVAIGAVAGAALTLVTGGMALDGALIGGIAGGIFNWFHNDKIDKDHDLAVRKSKAKFDEETLQLNCMYNELHKDQIYAGSVPNQMPSGVYVGSAGSDKAQVHVTGSYDYRSYQDGYSSGNDGRSTASCNGGCGYSQDYNRSGYTYDNSNSANGQGSYTSGSAESGSTSQQYQQQQQQETYQAPAPVQQRTISNPVTDCYR